MWSRSPVVIRRRRSTVSGLIMVIALLNSLSLPQQQIHRPAAADVRAEATAMGEQIGVGAAGVFEGVGQERQFVESAVVVDVPGDGRDGAAIPGEPMWLDRDRAEWVAEDVAEQTQVKGLGRLRGPARNVVAFESIDGFNPKRPPLVVQF